MKNKLLALMLCLAMLISMLAAFTACSEKSEDPAEGEGEVDGSAIAKVDGAKTLTMWVVTENKKDADGNFSKDVQKAMDDVEEAFSKITKSDYKTNIDIKFLTEDEYYGKLQTAISANTNVDDLVDEAERALIFYMDVMNQKIKNQEIEYMNNEAIENQFYVDYPEWWPYRDGGDHLPKSNADTQKEDEYILNEWGVPELKYPDADENQVDIIYLYGQDKMIEYINNDWLAPLDEDIGGVGMLLSDYIAPALLQGIKYNGVTYAIPNNIAIGEYTYMLIDKEMYDSFGYSKTFSSDVGLIDCGAFLKDVAGNINNADSACYNALPIASNFEETMGHYVWYWNMSYESGMDSLGNIKDIYTIGSGSQMSVFGALYGAPESATRGQISLGFNNLIVNAEYQNILKTLKGYDINGYYGTLAEGQKAAISYKIGDYSIKNQAAANDGVYTDENGNSYYVSVVKYPQVGEEELYGNMFAVCSASRHAYACVEVLTALNTDARLRNILQYGIEEGSVENHAGHYRINENTGVLQRIPLASGEYYSMDIEKTGNCFVAHPEEGLAPDYWENAKKQNGEAVIDPLLGFDFNTELENGSGNSFNRDELNHMANASKIIENMINSASSEEDLAVIVSQLEKLFGMDVTIPSDDGGEYIYVNISKFTNPAFEDTNGGAECPYVVYQSWMENNGYVPAP